MRKNQAPEARLLMCPPEHYGVAYVINPWMEPHVGLADHALATRQWNDLRAIVAEFARIDEIAPARGLPDMVFTANAGFVRGDVAIVSRFFAPARRGEELHFRNWFGAQGYRIAPWPDDICFEGAGDALFDASRDIIWCGYGFRSDARAPGLLQAITGLETQALHLVDPHFYHLDTCLCPLSNGGLIYYPPAFDEASRKAIEARVSADLRIAVTQGDAARFACNAVEIGGRVVMNDASAELQARLRSHGFEPVTTALGEFLKAGGGAKCLVLQLSK
jgi:N-dimethylarginine dimethylaminohydrolase